MSAVDRTITQLSMFEMEFWMRMDPPWNGVWFSMNVQEANRVLESSVNTAPPELVATLFSKRQPRARTCEKKMASAPPTSVLDPPTNSFSKRMADELTR